MQRPHLLHAFDERHRFRGDNGRRVFWSVDRFTPATTTQPPLSLSELRALLVSADDRLTLMCAPWGSGRRIAIDRDLDGILNEDE